MAYDDNIDDDDVYDHHWSYYIYIKNKTGICGTIFDHTTMKFSLLLYSLVHWYFAIILISTFEFTVEIGFHKMTVGTIFS